MKEKIKWGFLILVFPFMIQCSNSPSEPLSLIPQPAKTTRKSGSFMLSRETSVAAANEEIRYQSKYLTDRISQLELPENSGQGSIKLELDASLDDSLGNEGYRLVVNPNEIIIRAKAGSGTFYGIQTLLQLIDKDGRIPALDITDYPRFEWRGFMLDVSRHFMPKEYVLKVIDNLALHKLNTLHLHLVDDQGWRIEIKKYPLLTEIGAWRVDREDFHWNAREKQKPGEAATYGGFYTQEDIREMVAYAQERGITIVPEIEMPGHTTAALAAYPQYACTEGPFSVLPGGVWPITDIYCAGKEETFAFLQDILSEVIELFPSQYIHIGGDEANKKEWKKCPDCQRRIQKEGLQDENELQSYFIKRIEGFLNSQGRKLIGWDEILEGGLAPNAAVMSWRGVQGGIDAAKSGHPVVMTPTSHCYFDYYQGKPELEPLAIGGYLPLEKVYAFEPVPAELNAEEGKFVIGVQANLWTEYVPTPEHADYMTFPRLCALSEVAWSPAEKKEFAGFAQRLNHHLNFLKANSIGFAKSFANVSVSSSYNAENKSFRVELSNSIGFGEIHYTLDGSVPNADSPIYTKAFELHETCLIKAGTFDHNKLISAVSEEKVTLHLATGARIEYESEFSEKYSAGGQDALINSLRGTINLSDGRWQGYEGNSLQVLLDLGSSKEIRSVGLGCLQSVGSWVFFPEWVEVQILESVQPDAPVFFSARIENEIPPQSAERQIQDLKVTCNQSAQYIRIVAHNRGICPEWHSGAGSPSWLFVDEIIVE